MQPASEEDLKKVQQYYDGYRKDGNTELKSAYLAITGAGFVEAVESEATKVKYRRPSDDNYVVCSFALNQPQVSIIASQCGRVVKFFVD
jgi:hypothetical protein